MNAALFLSAALAFAPALQEHGSGHADGESGSDAEHAEREPNRLAGETSPYLRQHMYNPVDWYPWGPEAIERAKREDRPIFLSVGYSACHWCHVMERESFENPEIAALMNRWFVCIKVDREERPDVDEIYMAAVQRLTGRGGWPMSVFLTPELLPFAGGTYYPPTAARGRPGFDQILRSMHELWTANRDTAVAQGQRLIEDIRRQNAAGTSATGAQGSKPGPALFAKAVNYSKRRFDPQHGGFPSSKRQAPKFPRVTELVFLLRSWHRSQEPEVLEMVELSLTKMAQGGIYDQIGGGFARYSVDRTWTVPHFEKMLYDNSQLASLYMETWQATGRAFYRRIAEEILDYVLREMTDPEGGFYSTTDADSEGEEGKFFVWSLEEFDEVCGEHAPLARAWFGVTRRGNFEGHNILTGRRRMQDVARGAGLEVDEAREILETCRAALYERREQRIHPLLDDKIISSWNGLMLSAFARAAAVFDEPRYLAAARANAAFLLRDMRREDGGLYRTRRAGRSHLSGLLEDYAMVTAGLIDLFEADGDRRWLKAALELTAWVEAHFKDEVGGGYFSFSDQHEALPVRTGSARESSLPSDIGVAALNVARLGLLAGDTQLIGRAHEVLKRHGKELDAYPGAFGQLMLLLDFLESAPAEVYVVGSATDEHVRARLAELRKSWPPQRVFARVNPGGDEELTALLPAAEAKDLIDGRPAAYVCHEGVCLEPEVLGADDE